jgi:uncharacterized protein
MNDPDRLVGIISDTHGLVRPEAVAALRGSDLIIHAGDIGKPHVIDQLRLVAPTFVVRGNIDTQAWAADLPSTQTVEVGQLLFWVLHDIAQITIDPAAASLTAVAFGHSHRPSIETHDGVLYVNPGSAGPRRFKLPVSIARIHVMGQKLSPEIVELGV